jgi:site-specific recombinase XerC
MSAMLDGGAAPGRARIRQLGVRRFVAWLIATGHVPLDPFAGIKGPKQTHKLVTPLSDDELRGLIATCTTPTHRHDEPLHHRRDEAIIRLMFETGIRIGETVTLQVGDVDLPAGRVTVRRGKGGRGRVIPIGATTSAVLEAYLSLRADHRASGSQELWLGERGTSLGYDGLSRALRRRATLAGIAGFHPHKLRHTAAHRWLAAGGSESGLMAIAGWTRTDMLVRYTQAHASERAAAEASRLGLGQL